MGGEGETEDGAMEKIEVPTLFSRLRDWIGGGLLLIVGLGTAAGVVTSLLGPDGATLQDNLQDLLFAGLLLGAAFVYFPPVVWILNRLIGRKLTVTDRSMIYSAVFILGLVVSFIFYEIL